MSQLRHPRFQLASRRPNQGLGFSLLGGQPPHLDCGGDGHADPETAHAPPQQEAQPQRQRDAEGPIGAQVDQHAQRLPRRAADDACVKDRPRKRYI